MKPHHFTHPIYGGRHPLHNRLRNAVDTNDSRQVREAITANGDVRWLDCELKHAARHGHAESVRALLEAGADPRVKNDDAIYWARSWVNADMVDALLNTGVYDEALPGDIGGSNHLPPGDRMAIARWEARLVHVINSGKYDAGLPAPLNNNALLYSVWEKRQLENSIGEGQRTEQTGIGL